MGLRDAVREGHRVTVVNEESFFQYQPFLPEVASGTIDPRAAVVPLRRVLRHCRLVTGEVTRRSRAPALVRTTAGDERAIAYDQIVLAPGSRSRVLPYRDSRSAGSFKTVQEAIYLRNHVLAQLDVAASEEDAARRRAALTFVFVGGGYAGVEALGELEDLARDAIETYPDVDGSQMRWVLVDAADRILPELRGSRDVRGRAAPRTRDREARRHGLAGGRRDPALERRRVPGRDARVDRRREAVTARPRLRPAGRRRRPLARRPELRVRGSRTRGRRATRQRFPTPARAG